MEQNPPPPPPVPVFPCKCTLRCPSCLFVQPCNHYPRLSVPPLSPEELGIIIEERDRVIPDPKFVCEDCKEQFSHRNAVTDKPDDLLICSGIAQGYVFDTFKKTSAARTERDTAKRRRLTGNKYIENVYHTLAVADTNRKQLLSQIIEYEKYILSLKSSRSLADKKLTMQTNRCERLEAELFSYRRVNAGPLFGTLPIELVMRIASFGAPLVPFLLRKTCKFLQTVVSDPFEPGKPYPTPPPLPTPFPICGFRVGFIELIRELGKLSSRYTSAVCFSCMKRSSIDNKLYLRFLDMHMVYLWVQFKNSPLDVLKRQAVVPVYCCQIPNLFNHYNSMAICLVRENLRDPSAKAIWKVYIPPPPNDRFQKHPIVVKTLTEGLLIKRGNYPAYTQVCQEDYTLL